MRRVRDGSMGLNDTEKVNIKRLLPGSEALTAIIDYAKYLAVTASTSMPCAKDKSRLIVTPKGNISRASVMFLSRVIAGCLRRYLVCSRLFIEVGFNAESCW